MNGEQLIQCTECSASFRSRRGLMCHLAKTHKRLSQSRAAIRGRTYYSRHRERIRAQAKLMQDATAKAYHAKASKDWYDRNGPAFIARPEYKASRRKYYDAHKTEYIRRTSEYAMWRRYGLRPADYELLLAKQNGTCAICSGLMTTGRKLYVDHCHKSGKVRGLLCARCNTYLAAIENATWMSLAQEYLQKQRKLEWDESMHRMTQALDNIELRKTN